jgi:hypothetical protein
LTEVGGRSTSQSAWYTRKTAVSWSSHYDSCCSIVRLCVIFCFNVSLETFITR